MAFPNPTGIEIKYDHPVEYERLANLYRANTNGLAD